MPSTTRKRALPAPELLRELVDYDPETGKLIWKRRPLRPGKEYIDRHWNNLYFGKEAFTNTMANGYRRGYIYGVPLLAHRMIYAMYHGVWPDGEIDHINGIRDDNRIENLREADRHDQGRNMRVASNNTSGVTGVYWDKTRDKWMSCIKVNQKIVNLGRFFSKQDAIAARKRAEAAHGFHENHGDRPSAYR